MFMLLLLLLLFVHGTHNIHSRCESRSVEWWLYGLNQLLLPNICVYVVVVVDAKFGSVTLHHFDSYQTFIKPTASNSIYITLSVDWYENIAMNLANILWPVLQMCPTHKHIRKHIQNIYTVSHTHNTQFAVPFSWFTHNGHKFEW